jgi:hypothetical protein
VLGTLQALKRRVSWVQKSMNTNLVDILKDDIAVLGEKGKSGSWNFKKGCQRKE